MMRFFKILILLLAVAFLGNFFWSHQDQALARVHALFAREGEPTLSHSPSQAVSAASPSGGISSGASESAISSVTPLPIPVLELTKIPLTGKVENFTTMDGEHYTGVIRRVEPDGIVLRTSDGVPKLKFKNLPPEVGTKYGYDPDLELQFLKYKQAGDVSAYQEALKINGVKEPKKKAVPMNAEQQPDKQGEVPQQKTNTPPPGK